MSRKQKKNLIRIIITAILFAAGMILEKTGSDMAAAAVFIAAYILIGYDILIKSVKNISHGEVFDENFLMGVASFGAIALGQLEEAVAVVLFYQVGEWFQHYAVDRSRRNISELMDIRPDYANIQVDGKLEQVDPEEVQTGQTIVIQPGERVPLDGVVLSGTSSLDTSALTGESVPRSVSAGKDVISGCINQNGVLYVKVTKPYAQSTVARILELVENATDKKAPAEQFITRFAKYYTPAVCGLAMVLAIVPSLFDGNWSQWIYRALTFLVISCPCALVISVPLSFFGGIGGASRAGILIKGSTYLEQMSKVKTLVFDKTGTITKGTFNVTTVNPAGNMTAQTLLDYAGAAESFSTHPIAQSIVKAAGKDLPAAADVKETAGQGVTATVDGKQIAVGNAKLMKSRGIGSVPAGSGFGTIVYVAVDGAYAGSLEIADEVKEDSQVAISLLKKCGIRKCVMLTGDNELVARTVADSVGIDEYHAQLLPAQKAELLDKLLQQESPKERTAFVGDGINDAPVLTAADVGIAMGALGSDAAIEAADIVLMQDQLTQIVTTIQIARKTERIVYENIVFAIAVKVLTLILGALGIATMWWAVFADVGVAFLCILNAMRGLRVPRLEAAK